MNYFQYFLVFLSAVSRYVSISAFASLVGIPLGIASSAVGITICVSNGGIKKYKSIIKKKRKKHEKIKYYQSCDFQNFN